MKQMQEDWLSVIGTQQIRRRRLDLKINLKGLTLYYGSLNSESSKFIQRSSKSQYLRMGLYLDIGPLKSYLNQRGPVEYTLIQYDWYSDKKSKTRMKDNRVETQLETICKIRT